MNEKELISEVFDGSFGKSPFKLYTEELALKANAQIIFEDMINDPEYYNEFIAKTAKAVGGAIGKGVKAIGKGIGSLAGNLWNGMKEGFTSAGIDSEEEAKAMIEASMTDGKFDKAKFLKEAEKRGLDVKVTESLASKLEDEMGKAAESSAGDTPPEDGNKRISKSDFPKAFDAIKANMGELKKQANSPEIKIAIAKIMNKFPGIPEEKKKFIGPIMVGMASYFSN